MKVRRRSKGWRLFYYTSTAFSYIVTAISEDTR